VGFEDPERPEKGPPHRLAQIREARVERGGECSRDDGDREDDGSGKQESVAKTAQSQALEAEAKPVAQSLTSCGTPVVHVRTSDEESRASHSAP
jgi:hypothetical protein